MQVLLLLHGRHRVGEEVRRDGGVVRLAADGLQQVLLLLHGRHRVGEEAQGALSDSISAPRETMSPRTASRAVLSLARSTRAVAYCSATTLVPTARSGAGPRRAPAPTPRAAPRRLATRPAMAAASPPLAAPSP